MMRSDGNGIKSSSRVMRDSAVSSLFFFFLVWRCHVVTYTKSCLLFQQEQHFRGLPLTDHYSTTLHIAFISSTLRSRRRAFQLCSSQRTLLKKRETALIQTSTHTTEKNDNRHHQYSNNTKTSHQEMDQYQFG